MTRTACIGFLLLSTWLTTSLQALGQTPVTSGSELDYQGSILRPWDAKQERIVVFERLHPATLSGDLYLTSSSDAGSTWTVPVPVVATAANERHAEMVQTAANAFQLFYLSNASGGFRIHRASSSDGLTFSEQGAIDLGWSGGGEVNPHVIRLPGGRLVLVYHRLGGAAYVSWSDDDGASWNTDRIQVSPANAALPRIAYRPSDGRFLLSYQTNPGNNQLRIWARTTTNLANWRAQPVEVVGGGNNHDSMPLMLDDGSFVLLWARVIGDAFQIVSASSDDGAGWSAPRQVTFRSGLANVQPHGLVEPNGCVELYWGGEQAGAGGDYDILQGITCFDSLFGDRFQSAVGPRKHRPTLQVGDQTT